MRLKLTVHRHMLPPAKLIWQTTTSFRPADDHCVSTFLTRLSDVIPLEGNTWGLEDYVVEIGGFEVLHYTNIEEAAKEDEEVVVRPLSGNEVRERRLSGRTQISNAGRRLIDGAPFGRAFMRPAPDRPQLLIPARKRMRLEDSEEETTLQIAPEAEEDDEEELRHVNVSMNVEPWSARPRRHTPSVRFSSPSRLLMDAPLLDSDDSDSSFNDDDEENEEDAAMSDIGASKSSKSESEGLDEEYFAEPEDAADVAAGEEVGAVTSASERDDSKAVTPFATPVQSDHDHSMGPQTVQQLRRLRDTMEVERDGANESGASLSNASNDSSDSSDSSDESDDQTTKKTSKQSEGSSESSDSDSSTSSSASSSEDSSADEDLAQVELPSGSGKCLAGMSFVFTGELAGLGRKEAMALVIQHGGVVAKAPNEETSFIVMGEDVPHGKLLRLESLNVKTLDQSGLFKLIREQSKAAQKATEEEASRQQKAVPPSSPSKAHGIPFEGHPDTKQRNVRKKLSKQLQRLKDQEVVDVQFSVGQLKAWLAANGLGTEASDAQVIAKAKTVGPVIFKAKATPHEAEASNDRPAAVRNVPKGAKKVFHDLKQKGRVPTHITMKQWYANEKLKEQQEAAPATLASSSFVEETSVRLDPDTSYVSPSLSRQPDSPAVVFNNIYGRSSSNKKWKKQPMRSARPTKMMYDDDGNIIEASTADESSLPVDAYLEEIEGHRIPGEEDDVDMEDSWHSKIVLSAVECEQKNVRLPTPGFPFEQPQLQESNGNVTRKGQKKRKRVHYQETDNYGYGDENEYDYGDENQEWTADMYDDTTEAPTKEAEDDLPSVPSDVSALYPLIQPVRVGTIMIFKQLTMDASFRPHIADYRTALVDHVEEEGGQCFLILKLAKRDWPKKVLDEDGKPVLGKLEMPGYNLDQEEGVLQVMFSELLEPKIVQLPESSPSSSQDQGAAVHEDNGGDRRDGDEGEGGNNDENKGAPIDSAKQGERRQGNVPNGQQSGNGGRAPQQQDAVEEPDAVMEDAQAMERQVDEREPAVEEREDPMASFDDGNIDTSGIEGTPEPPKAVEVSEHHAKINKYVSTEATAAGPDFELEKTPEEAATTAPELPSAEDRIMADISGDASRADAGFSNDYIAFELPASDEHDHLELEEAMPASTAPDYPVAASVRASDPREPPSAQGTTAEEAPRATTTAPSPAMGQANPSTPHNSPPPYDPTLTEQPSFVAETPLAEQPSLTDETPLFISQPFSQSSEDELASSPPPEEAAPPKPQEPTQPAPSTPQKEATPGPDENEACFYKRHRDDIETDSDEMPSLFTMLSQPERIKSERASQTPSLPVLPSFSPLDLGSAGKSSQSQSQKEVGAQIMREATSSGVNRKKVDEKQEREDRKKREVAKWKVDRRVSSFSSREKKVPKPGTQVIDLTDENEVEVAKPSSSMSVSQKGRLGRV